MLSVTLISPNLSPFHAPSFSDIRLPKHLKHRNPFDQTKNTTNSQIHHFKIFECFSTNSNISVDFSSRQENPDGICASRERDDALTTVDYIEDSGLLAGYLQRCSNVEDVKKVHTAVVKCVDSNSGAYVRNNLISAYARVGNLIDAQKVFDVMFERNVVSWTAILSGYMAYGFDNEALSLFLDLVENGLQPNGKTFVCVLNLCSKRFDFDFGRQLHACVVKGGFSNLIVESSVMYFYAQFGCVSDAFRVFDQMEKRDVVCWTTMITACSQHGRGEDAFVLFSQMISDGFAPNEFTVCSVLKACADEKVLSFGRQLHGGIVKKVFRNDVFLGTSLVDMYAKCGEIKDSRTVFDGMRRRNMVTWTSIIAGYARNGLGEEAINLFRVMNRRKISANRMTMVSLIRACGLIRASRTGKEVHAQIIRNNFQDNIYLDSTLVWHYCKCEEYSAAFNVLNRMTFRDVVSWTVIISGCARLGHELEALEFLNEMLGEGVDPNPYTYSSALKACAKLENVWQGKLIHSSVNKTHALSNVYVGSALINMYAKCGYVSEAAEVFDSMPERNLVAWNAMIVGYVKNGLCGEAMKLVYQMQAEGFVVDDYILSTALTTSGDLESSMEQSAVCSQTNG